MRAHNSRAGAGGNEEEELKGYRKTEFIEKRLVSTEVSPAGRQVSVITSALHRSKASAMVSFLTGLLM
jgi:hypothetical protein